MYKNIKMKFSESLKKNIDFNKVYNNGKFIVNKQLVLYYIKNYSNKNRLGIVVSKKVGNSIICHNLKRLVKESYRIHENEFNKGFDIVIIVRKSALNSNYWQIEKSLLHLKNILIEKIC